MLGWREILKELEEQERQRSSQHPIRIALVGRQRSGKDTVARYLQREKEFYRAALADPIYWIAEEFFGMEGKDRQLLIDIGEKMREIDKDVWLKTLMQDYYDEPKLVVSDVRMMNEYKFLKSQGFIFVRIYSDDVTRASREGFDPFAEKDRTETEIGEIPCDFLLVNEGTLEELELMTETLADMWLGI